MIKSIGLPSIHKEEGEKRAFLPELVKWFAQFNVDLYIEQGYGSKMGYTEEDYLNVNPRVQFVPAAETMKQDLVLVLRAPNFDELDLMKPGSNLLSMLHYESRPVLLDKLLEQQIRPFSIDSIVDDNNRRLVVNYRGTAWGGLKYAFAELAKSRKDFFEQNRPPLKATIIGFGNLGIEAGRGAMRYGDENLYTKAKELNLPGVVVEYLEIDVTKNPENVARILAQTDMLIDATRRMDYSKHIINNDLIAYLKEDAVILDLAADPYDIKADPMNVKAIEGVPYGTLNQYVFYPVDSAYEDIPKEISTQNRRISVSCNAWPGVLPIDTMDVYGQQLKPFLEVLLSKEPSDLSGDSKDYAERAIWRALPPAKR